MIARKYFEKHAFEAAAASACSARLLATSATQNHPSTVLAQDRRDRASSDRIACCFRLRQTIAKSRATPYGIQMSQR